MRTIVSVLIRIYKLFLSPVLGSSCRFQPTCSSYALEAYRERSFFTATLLVIKRISKCHPYHSGGYDPL
ncbi:MAG: membrane protein insertion efficiency factor YidD [Candidatus Marinimicrobia bacterium]|nr:membrane protein insertion efficiency factor YidD [Candidatus Neomarinimicrobiota bacterium]